MGQGSGETASMGRGDWHQLETQERLTPRGDGPPGGETTSRQWFQPCPDTVAESQAGLDRQSPEWRVTWEFPFGNRVWVQLVRVLKPHQGLGGSRFVLVSGEELPLY